LEGGIERLLLGNACLSTDGIREILWVLTHGPGALRYVDIIGCRAVGEMEQELVKNFPYARGCSLEAPDCGLSDQAFERLKNQTDAARAALQEQEDRRRRNKEMIEKYISRQEVLEDFAAMNCSREVPPDPSAPLCHPWRWREGIEWEPQRALQAFTKANPGVASLRELDALDHVILEDGSRMALDVDSRTVLQELRDEMLEDWGCILERAEEEGEACPGVMETRILEGGRPLPDAFSEAFGPQEEVLGNPVFLAFMVSSGVRPAEEAVERLRQEREAHERAWRERMKKFTDLSRAAKKVYDVAPACPGIASGQIIAHFTYLCAGMQLSSEPPPLQPLSHFGLKRLSEKPRPAPRRGTDLHEALLAGDLCVKAVKGTSFGSDAVELMLENTSSSDMEVAIQQGTIFQHIDWQHRQNLMVSMDYFVVIRAGELLVKHLYAYCMNLTCACSSGNPMSLTEFYFDNHAVLEDQSSVWGHFQRSFGDLSDMEF